MIIQKIQKTENTITVNVENRQEIVDFGRYLLNLKTSHNVIELKNNIYIITDIDTDILETKIDNFNYNMEQIKIIKNHLKSFTDMIEPK